MKKLITSTIKILSLLGFYSCSSTYKQPETFSSKMDRFKPQGRVINLIPLSPPLPSHFSFSRKPASLKKTEGEKKKPRPSKHLYFLTLFKQYQTFQTYSSVSLPSLKTCPHFHTPLLREGFNYSKNSYKRKLNFSFLNKSHLEDVNFLSSSPELYLP